MIHTRYTSINGTDELRFYNWRKGVAWVEAVDYTWGRVWDRVKIEKEKSRDFECRVI